MASKRFLKLGKAMFFSAHKLLLLLSRGYESFSSRSAKKMKPLWKLFKDISLAPQIMDLEITLIQILQSWQRVFLQVEKNLWKSEMAEMCQTNSNVTFRTSNELKHVPSSIGNQTLIPWFWVGTNRHETFFNSSLMKIEAHFNAFGQNTLFRQRGNL